MLPAQSRARGRWYREALRSWVFPPFLRPPPAPACPRVSETLEISWPYLNLPNRLGRGLPAGPSPPLPQNLPPGTCVIRYRYVVRKTAASSPPDAARQDTSAAPAQSLPEPPLPRSGIQPAARSTDAAPARRPRRSNRRPPSGRSVS